MHVVLIILKIIGIVFLCIIGLLLLILMTALFVPVRYRIYGTREDGNSPVIAKANVSYLLHIFSVWVIYQDGIDFKVKIFGIPINLNKKKKTETELEESKSEKSEECESVPEKEESYTLKEDDYVVDWNEDVQTDYSEEATCINENVESNIDTINKETVGTDSIINDNFIETIDEEKKETESDEDIEKESLWEKISKYLSALSDFLMDFPEKLYDFLDKTEDNIDNIVNKFDEVEKKYLYWQRMINDAKNKNAVSRLFAEVKKIIKSILPRVIKGRIHFGFSDPASTGQILVYLSMMAPIIPGKVQFQPDFEYEGIDGNIYLKGRFTLVNALIAGFRLFINKDVRRLIKIIRKKSTK